MRNLTAAAYVAMPWKNGGGTTTQLAISPPEAGLDDFDWRISSAQVASAGAFSFFPGIDRSLAVLKGSLLLVAEDRATAALAAGDRPLVFRGEQQIQASLPHGPVVDFNVMTRRSVCRHQLHAIGVLGSRQYRYRADLMLLYVAQGDCIECRNASGEATQCEPGEAILLERSDCAEFELRSWSPASVLAAAILFKEANNV
jgi:uncharacterized protein